MLFKIDKIIIYIFIVIASLLLFSNTTNAAVLPPGNISTCGELAVGGTYTLTTDVGTSTELCFIVTADSVVIDGQSTYTISGDIGGNRDSYTINNATTTGNLSYFYYNNADDDGDWTNMGNWWLDSSYTQTADLGNISEPTLEDTSFINGAVYRVSSGNTPQSKDITFNNDSSFSAATLPLDIATATAAYSLRNLSTTYNGDVVRVRRSSDDAEQDFSAQEVGDGTLTSWVDEDIVEYTSDFSVANPGWGCGNCTDVSQQNIGGEDDVLMMTPNTETSTQHFFQKTDVFTNAITFEVSFDYYIPSSNNFVDGIQGVEGGGSSFSNILTEIDQWTSFTGAHTGDGNRSLRFRVAQNGDVSPDSNISDDRVYIKNVVIKNIEDDGHVTTWYDQSGNGNNLTQSSVSSQPVIVEDGNYLGYIKPDGINDTLGFNIDDVTVGFSNTDFSSFWVATANTEGGAPYLISNGNTFFIRWATNDPSGAGNNGFSIFGGGGLVNLGLTNSTFALGSAFILSSGDSDGFYNGTQQIDGNTTDTYSFSFFNLVRRGTAYANNYLKELMYYLSDQTSNREQIEASINDYYDIYEDSYTYELDLEVATTGTVIFNDNSYFGNGTISTQSTSSIDTITFNDNSYAMDMDIYTDNLTFNNYSSSTGIYEIQSDNTNITVDEINPSNTLTLTGDTPELTLNGTSTLNTITSDDIDITLNDSSYLSNFTLTGDDTTIKFNTDYYHGTSTPDNGILEINQNITLEGSISQYDTIELLDSDDDPITQINFNNSSVNNISNLPVYSTFNDSSSNTGSIRANAVFSDTSTNTGTIYGNVTVNSPVTKPLGGTVTGNITYQGYAGFYYNNAQGDGDYNNALNWWSDSDFSIPASVPNSGGDDINIYGDLSSPTDSVINVQSANFYSGTNDLTFISDNPVNFYNTAVNNGVISATTTFHGDSSEHTGFVTNNELNQYPNRMNFDGINDYIAIPDVGTINGDDQTEGKREITFVTSDDITTKQMIYEEGGGTNGLNFYIDNGLLYAGWWSEGTSGTDNFHSTSIQENTEYTVSQSFNESLNTFVAQLDGQTFGSGTVDSYLGAHAGDIGIGALANQSKFHTGDDTSSLGSYFEGLIFDFKVYSDSAGNNLVHSYEGYGNTDADWEDQVGSADGTVVGSPTVTTTAFYDTNDGTLIRRYEADTNVGTRDFTENNGIWIVEAVSADVDLSSSTYSTGNNVFRAIAGGTFTENPAIGGGGNVVPKVEIEYPINGTNTALWNPTIDWSDADTCEYKYGANGTYQSLDCSNNGSDIPQPTALVETTLYVKGSYDNTSYSEQLQTFIYDNVSPIAIDCSVPLSEATREYYYLDENITRDCLITASSTIKGEGYTIDGSVIANASSTDSNGYNLTLENIIITGTTTANAKDGGNGGTIRITDSTTASVESNGADSNDDGGSGGTITIINSLGNPLSSTVTANGGDSLSCGDGGDSGNITLSNSSYGTLTAQPGEANNTGCPSEEKQTGTRTPPQSSGQHTSQTSSSGSSSTSTTPPASSSDRDGFVNISPLNPLNFEDTEEFTPITSFTPNQVGSTIVPNPLENFQAPGQAPFRQIPTNFGLSINNFLFQESPQEIQETINTIPAISNLASSGILNLTPQQIARLSTKPVLIEDVSEDQGLFIIEKEDGTNPPTYLTYRDGKLSQLVKLKPSTNVVIKLNPLFEGEVSATYQGITFPFRENSQGEQFINIETLPSSGTYLLSTDSTLLPLYIQVVGDAPQQEENNRRNFKGLIPWLFDLIFVR